jgi:UDP-glucose 4-epimerase
MSARFTGHEVFYIVAPETAMNEPSAMLKQRFFADVPVRGELQGHQSFYSTAKAEQILGWTHNLPA